MSIYSKIVEDLKDKDINEDIAYRVIDVLFSNKISSNKRKLKIKDYFTINYFLKKKLKLTR